MAARLPWFQTSSNQRTASCLFCSSAVMDCGEADMASPPRLRWAGYTGERRGKDTGRPGERVRKRSSGQAQDSRGKRATDPPLEGAPPKSRDPHFAATRNDATLRAPTMQ